jgi:hypothetical protein
MRQTGDYDDCITFDKETLLELFPLGLKLIETIESLLTKKIKYFRSYSMEK